jgi:hypothetical protein
MKLLLFIITTLAACLSSIAQPVLRENQFEGYIVDNEGVKSEVIIEVEDISQPWTFQHDIMYFDRSLATGTRVKREFKKHALPGDIIEYGIPGRKFLYVDYYIKGDEDNNIFATKLNQFKDEKNTDFFAEVVDDRKIQVLRFYIPSQEEDEEETGNNDTPDESEVSYDILFQREGFSAQSVNEISFKDFFSDCPFVLNKYKEEKYRIKPRKGLAKVSGKSLLSGSKLETAADRIIQDFYARCGQN